VERLGRGGKGFEKTAGYRAFVHKLKTGRKDEN
jgi:hypothetical protein